jgi:hypothetical protein
MKNITFYISSKLHYIIHKPFHDKLDSDDSHPFFRWPISEKSPFLKRHEYTTYFGTIKKDLICQNKKNG